MQRAKVTKIKLVILKGTQGRDPPELAVLMRHPAVACFEQCLDYSCVFLELQFMTTPIEMEPLGVSCCRA
jgi:hypothetical protein